MVRVREVIVVEGRYDKNTLSQVVDATTLPVLAAGGIKKESLRIFSFIRILFICPPKRHEYPPS